MDGYVLPVLNRIAAVALQGRVPQRQVVLWLPRLSIEQ